MKSWNRTEKSVLLILAGMLVIFLWLRYALEKSKQVNVTVDRHSEALP